MGMLYYDILVFEEELDVKTRKHKRVIENNLPHHNKIKNMMEKEWVSCRIKDTFYGILKDKIQTADMKVRKVNNKETVARITVKSIPGFRFTKKVKEEIVRQLDAQMTDGFGENLDNSKIPGAPDNYRLML